MRLRVLLLCGALAIAATGCALQSVIRGDGHVVSESRSVSGFHALSLSGTGLLRLRQTGTESLMLEAESNILPNIETRSDDGRLILGPKPGTRLESTLPIVYMLTVKSVDGLTVSGSGSTDAIDLDNDTLEVILSGSGIVTTAGTVRRQDIKVSGSASYRAEALRSQDVAITVSGAGGGVVHAVRTLDAQVSGSGSVEYVGAPLLTKQISGSSSIRQR
jgi:Putative auto-transporter adhesin, head GIN domain